jgi:hypothetical protein
MTTPDEAQLPLVAQPWTPTGDVRVDSAVELIGDLANLPVAEHLAVFEDVHRRLQDTLADASGQ